MTENNFKVRNYEGAPVMRVSEGGGPGEVEVRIAVPQGDYSEDDCFETMLPQLEAVLLRDWLDGYLSKVEPDVQPHVDPNEKIINQLFLVIHELVAKGGVSQMPIHATAVGGGPSSPTSEGSYHVGSGSTAAGPADSDSQTLPSVLMDGLHRLADTGQLGLGGRPPSTMHELSNWARDCMYAMKGSD